jgi:hypothetical protein
MPNGAYIPAGLITFDEVYVGRLPSFTLDWTPDTEPMPLFFSDYLKNIWSCELAARMGKPCTDERATFAASEGVWAITYTTSGSMLKFETLCWNAPHTTHTSVRSNFSVSTNNGMLKITSDVFRDKYHNGSPDYIISDSFCSTMLGIPFAMNYWDDSIGDVLGCSKAHRKGDNYIPIQCRITPLGSAEVFESNKITLIDHCFGIDDLIAKYDGASPTMRCFTDENINACGGVLPEKNEFTIVITVPAALMPHSIHTVRQGNHTISLVQWFTPDDIPDDYLLVSDCAVFAPLCNLHDPTCPYNQTLLDYLAAPPPLDTDGNTDVFYNYMCSEAHFIHKEYFYVVPGTIDGVKVVGSWPGIKLISLDATAPSARCSSFKNVTSIGTFVVIDAQRDIDHDRPLASFAMVYDISFAVNTHVEKRQLGDMCMIAKGDEDADVAVRLPALVATNMSQTIDDDLSAQCAARTLRTTPNTFIIKECTLTPNHLIDCTVSDYTCTTQPTHGVRTIDQCKCCRQAIDSGSTITYLDTVIDCDSCDNDTVDIIPNSLQCYCAKYIPEETIDVWVYTPYILSIPGTAGSPATNRTYPMHGTCSKVTFSVSTATRRDIFQNKHACMLANNNCAKGYTLYSTELDGAGHVKNASVSENFACFIDPPRWGDLDQCRKHCRARVGTAGEQWFAHCSGKCKSFGLGNCHSYVIISAGFEVDGGVPYMWGALMTWTQLDPKLQMGNHFIPHYVCLHDVLGYGTSSSARAAHVAWYAATVCKSTSCDPSYGWNVHSTGDDRAQYDAMCYTNNYPALTRVKTVPIPRVP